MTRRISVSRPITGSSLPAFARSTRSMPYFSSAWNLASGLSSVTRAVPAHGSQCLQDKSCLPDAVQLQQTLGRRLDFGQRQQQVFGRDELVLHPIGFSLRALKNLVAGFDPTGGRRTA